jgi:hypothetical protein
MLLKVVTESLNSLLEYVYPNCFDAAILNLALECLRVVFLQIHTRKYHEFSNINE